MTDRTSGENRMEIRGHKMTVCPDCGKAEARNENIDQLCDDSAHGFGGEAVEFVPAPARGTVEPSPDDRRWTLRSRTSSGLLTVIDGPRLEPLTQIEVMPVPQQPRGAVSGALDEEEAT